MVSMKKLKDIISTLFFILLSFTVVFLVQKCNSSSDLQISQPISGALFPPEFPAPEFAWWGPERESSSYDLKLFTKNKDFIIQVTTDQTRWVPEESAWDSLKILSDFDKIFFTVKRTGEKTEASTNFRISRDSVGAPILYRQMPIPFLVAEKQLDSMNFMLIDVGSKQKPHTAMKGFPVCGNCHSFSADGSTIGLDLDAGLRDKGGYFVSKIEDTVLFNLANYRSWSKLEKRRTFGLFSKLSPDGRYIVTTVKDRVVIKNFPFPPVENITYSQLFFPVNGQLGIYDRETKTLQELPGANLDEYVQTNAIWTPDGENIIFSRAKALPMGSDPFEIDVKDEALIKEFVERKRTFKYDLYMIPFNKGKGGKAEPIKGASDNGKSNYFPAISPDGKWIVYCQADNFMLLMPDSRLHIVPTSGGKSKRLECNFNSMNSWHSWSPNSKWIVFVSKIFGAHTDMFLSHIDERGEASIPVLVEKARAPYRVVNYPEFVNRRPGDTFVMNYDFVELAHINRALRSGDIEKAKELYSRLEEQQLYFFKEDCEDLSYMLNQMGMPEEALKYDELAKHTINSSVFRE